MNEFNLKESDLPKHMRLSNVQDIKDQVEQNIMMTSCYNEINKFMHISKMEYAVVAQTEAKEKKYKQER